MTHNNETPHHCVLMDNPCNCQAFDLLMGLREDGDKYFHRPVYSYYQNIQ